MPTGEFTENTELKAEKTPVSEKFLERVALVSKETGWDDATVKKSMRAAREKGLSNAKYVQHYAWDLSEDQIEQLVAEEGKSRIRRSEKNSFLINTVVQKSGLSRDDAESKMADAKELGISYLKYVENECWKMDEDQLNQLAAWSKNKKDTVSVKKREYLDAIMARTGWSRGVADLEIQKAKNLTGASYEDYYAFKFDELTPELQKEYATIDTFKKLRVKYNNYGVSHECFDNKAKFNALFSDQIHHKWFVNTDLTYESFLENMVGLTNILVKPLASTQGLGIQKYECNQSKHENKKLYKFLVSQEPLIIEEYIKQSDEVAKFCPTSVNTLRITTLNFNGECKFLYSVFRMGRGDVVDNFHAGGIAAAVDLKTGIVCTDATDLDGNFFSVHPYSGLKIKGFQIPHWDIILDTCRKMFDRVDGTGLIGWDFAITPDGVDLIEGNPGASYVVAQLPFVAEKKGLKKEMIDPYI